MAMQWDIKLPVGRFQCSYEPSTNRRGILGEKAKSVLGEKFFQRDIPVLCTILAAIVLHAPGLYCKLKFGSSLAIFGGLVGSVCEGTFVLLILTKLMAVTGQLTRQATVAVKSGESKVVCSAISVALLFSIVLLVIFACALIAFNVADYTFQLMSGGMTPNMWIVANGIANAADVGKQLASDNGDPHQTKRVEVVCFFFAASLVIYSAGQHLRCKGSKKNRGAWPVSNKHLVGAGAAAVLVYAVGAWSPIMHSYLSFLGSFMFIAEGADIVIGNEFGMREGIQNNINIKRPNVIYLVPDSLAGAYVNTEEGRQATPFLQSLLHDNDDVYYFPHVRAVSGNTVDALTALETGCLAYTDTGKKIAFSRSIGTEFKRQGYQTASFSTTKLDLQVGIWQMIGNYLTANMDSVFDPGSENHPILNGEGSDDRLFLPIFEKWLKEDVHDAFFAQFFQFNTHFPYMKVENSTASHKYYGSMGTFDETLKSIFGILEKTGQLNNTIIFASADHGEHLDDNTLYSRLGNLNPFILQPLTFMYVPAQLFSSEKARETLRSNQDRVVSTLDLFPTMQHVLYGGDSTETSDERALSKAADVSADGELEHCVTGFDLMSLSIPEDRVAISWNIVSEKRPQYRLVAVSSADRGMYRKGDWGGGISEFQYGNCTASGKGECTRPMTENDRTYWKNLIHDMHNSSTMSKQFMNSKFVDVFLEELERLT